MKKPRFKMVIIIIVIVFLSAAIIYPVLEKEGLYRRAIRTYNELEARRDCSEDVINELEVLTALFSELHEYRQAALYYKKAMELWASAAYASGNYRDAYAILHRLGYTASENAMMSEIKEIEPNVELFTAQIGDIVTFGRYEIDGNGENGDEPLKWIVLEVNEDRKLLLTLQCIDVLPFNINTDMNGWENSFIRSWLDNDLYTYMFNEEEKALIKTICLDETLNKAYGTKAEKTDARVFILSREEYVEYVLSKQATDEKTYETLINVKFTPFATSKGAKQCLGYWLRTPAIDYDGAVYVTVKGTMHSEGDGGIKYNLVRPAVWIDVD